MTITAHNGYTSTSQEELRAAAYLGEHAHPELSTSATRALDQARAPPLSMPAAPAPAPATSSAARLAAAEASSRAQAAARDARIKHEAAEAAVAAAAEAAAKAQACSTLTSSGHLPPPRPAGHIAGGTGGVGWGLSGLLAGGFGNGLLGISELMGSLDGMGGVAAAEHKVVARMLGERRDLRLGSCLCVACLCVFVWLSVCTHMRG